MQEVDVPRYLAVGMGDVPADDRWLTAAESERLAGFPFTKRRLEARLGRWAAKNAVARVLRGAGWSGELDEIVIRNAADGAPEVFLDGEPAPVHISMTDRADWAVCVVTARAAAAGVGCDLEVVEPRSRLFLRDWFTPVEQDLVDDSGEPDLFANLVWSAKESALKVLRTGLRRDTRSVEVALGRGTEGGWNELAVRSAEGEVFPGWWRRAGSFVVTYAAARPTPPPQGLVDPDPLDSAVPTHSWMETPLV